MIEYDCQIRMRGRPWYQTARRVSLGYELDPAENRGFVLTIPAYLVIEEVAIASPADQFSDESPSSFLSDLCAEMSANHHLIEAARCEPPARRI